MKKFLLTLGAALLAFGASAADTEYTVYNNGDLAANLNIQYWWNASVNLSAPNPDGDNLVYEFKAADGGTNASMGFESTGNPNTGIFAKATLHFSWYANVAGATYKIRLTAGQDFDYTFTVTEDQINKWNTTSLDIATEFPTLSQLWNENAADGKGYIFAVVLENGVINKVSSIIYFDNIYYTGVDYDWTPAASTIPAPETVPNPEYAADDVLSVYSSFYNPAITFELGYWNQSTSVTNKEIDGKAVEYFTNFNYQGWQFLNSVLDITDYDYMNVDVWTVAEGKNFGVTPISKAGSVTEKSIVSTLNANDWTTIQIPVKVWADAGLDLSQIFQIKFDQGDGYNCYVTNVFFYKDGDEDPGTDPDPGEPSEPGEGATYADTIKVTYTQTMPADDVKTYDYIFDYSITYNADKTLTITGKFTWPNGAPVGYNNLLSITIPGIWSDNGTQDDTFTSDKTFEKDSEITIEYKSGVALGNVEVNVPYKVGSSIDTGINGIIDNAAGSVEYYNLQGVKVANPENGIFIRVERGKVSKILK